MLKKLTAIFFFSLFLFNIIGYRVYIYYAQKQDDINMLASLDKSDYNEDDLITIKVPISLPYQTNWKDFERVDGEVTLEGKVYKYVKRKIQDGQMVLMCLPDEHKTRLQTARDDFFKLANDLTANTSSKKPNSATTIKNSLGDYDKFYDQSPDAFSFNKAVYELPVNITQKTIPFHNTPEQPPC